MNNNHVRCREDNNNNNNSYCYFHPREVVIGVCPLCLNERLVILASSTKARRSTKALRSSTRNDSKKPQPSMNFHKIFDFGSLLHRLEFRTWKSDFHDHHHDDTSTSQEDSFISIKFEENGKASWEKNNAIVENCNNKINSMSWNHQSKQQQQQQQEQHYKGDNKTVIEHGKPRSSSLRWRKRIGHAFHLIRWKRSNKGSVCQVSSKVEGVKVVRKGWIRTLTKKRTME